MPNSNPQTLDCQIVFADSLVRHDVEDTRVRCDFPDCSLNIFRDRHRIVLRAHHKVSLLGVTLVTGSIEIVTGFIDEAVVFDITNDADDFGTAGTIIVAVNSFTQRIIVGPHPLGQPVTNYRHIAKTIRSERVAISEDAAAE